MMIPKIEEGQFQLVICESTTGIILNDDLEYALNGSVFHVFYSLGEAKEFIEKIKRPNAYFQVFDHNVQIVFELEVPAIETKVRMKKLWWQFWKS